MKKLTLLSCLLFVSVSSFAYEILTGESVRLSATADGTAPFTYVWSKNGVVIPSVTVDHVDVPTATADMAGSYSVVIKNSAGSATASIVITVRPAPPIVIPPSNPKLQLSPLQKLVAWLKEHSRSGS